MVLVNKYDGVDLPADACRLLIPSGSPAPWTRWNGARRSRWPTAPSAWPGRSSGIRVEAGTAAASPLGTDGMLTPADGVRTRFVLPKNDPFMAWAQRADIFKDAKHPAAAKLYLNWWLDKQIQSDFYMWSVRTDVAPHAGDRPIWDYPNANLDGFDTFMADRALVERFLEQLALYVGEVTERRPRAGWDCTPDASAARRPLYPPSDGGPETAHGRAARRMSCSPRDEALHREGRGVRGKKFSPVLTMHRGSGRSLSEKEKSAERLKQKHGGAAFIMGAQGSSPRSVPQLAEFRPVRSRARQGGGPRRGPRCAVRRGPGPGTAGGAWRRVRRRRGSAC